MKQARTNPVGGKEGTRTTGTSRDPVCGMTVEGDGHYTTSFEGKEYHFCAQECLDTFELDPRKYVA